MRYVENTYANIGFFVIDISGRCNFATGQYASRQLRKL